MRRTAPADLQQREREGQPTVLLIEDDPRLGQLVSEVLAAAGYVPVAITDHGQIGAAVDRWRPKCVILDGALLPTGQGRSWGEASAIRQAHPHLPVVMFTGDAAALAEARAGTSGRSRAAGFAGVVGKPFVISEFLATVRGAVDSTDTSRTARRSHADDGMLAIAMFPHAVSPAAEDPAVAGFFNAVVHELRTPLTVISSQIQVARRYQDEPERQQVALDRALVQIARMDRLISDLLDRSRVRGGGLALEIVAFDLCALVADVIAQHERGDCAQFRFRRVRPDIRVHGDPFRVAQIVGNLVNNAMRYGSPGSPIELTLDVVDAEALLLIEDHGVGVPAEEQDRIFETYYRSTRTRSVPGTGLGLNISRILAERHGGRLWLERSSDTGSVFALALPLAGPEAPGRGIGRALACREAGRDS